MPADILPLVEAVNHQMAQAPEVIGRERAFLDDASHQLHTLLTRLRAQIDLEAYAPLAQRVFASFAKLCAVTTEADVAETVWLATNDTSGRLGYAAGADAAALAQDQPQVTLAPWTP